VGVAGALARTVGHRWPVRSVLLKILSVGSSRPYPSHAPTAAAQQTARGCNWGWLDRGFRELSNAGTFVGFGGLVIPSQSSTWIKI
jgi:hypothetical protein